MVRFTDFFVRCKLMKKLFTIISIILLGIATLGFLYVPQHFDTQINNKLDKIDNLTFDEDRTIMNLQASERYYYIAVTQRDSATILRTLNNTSAATAREKFMIQGLRGAVISAIKAAQVSTAISDTEEINETKKVVELKTYEEIWPVYFHYIKKAQEGVKEMRKSASSLRGQINSLRLNKDKVWYSTFIFQSLGIISALIAAFYEVKDDKNKTSNNSMEMNADQR